MSKIIARELKRTRKAIDAMCKHCIYDSADKVDGRTVPWRKQVENCTSPKCPLYAERPTLQ